MLEAARRDGPQQAERQQRVRGDGDRFDVEAGQRGDPAQLGVGSSSAAASATLRASGARRPRRASVASTTALGVSPSIACTSLAMPATPSWRERAQQFRDVERRSPGHRMTGLR